MLTVLDAGVQTLVQDWTGRVGYLDQGIAPSGAMDHFAIRAANLIVANPLNEATLEILAGSVSLKFETATLIAITGANLKPRLDGNSVPLWEAVKVERGEVLSFQDVDEATLGFRNYLAIAGGIAIPLYLGSKATAIYGRFGGYQGRALQDGDQLKLLNPDLELSSLAGRKFNPSLIPEYSRTWELRAVPGPDGAPDYFTEEGMELFFTTEFPTQVVSDRAGIRLVSPKLGWAKERLAAGRHPADLWVEHPYPMPGTLNISGDTPIILAREGPTLGGYVCALTVIYADQWKLGQVIPGRDTVNFVCCTPDEATQIRKAQGELFTEKSIIY